MHRARIQDLLAWAALAVYALACLSPFDRLVACVQASGAVTLEAAAADRGCLDCGTPSDDCCPSEDGAPCRDVVVLEKDSEAAPSTGLERALADGSKHWIASDALAFRARDAWATRMTERPGRTAPPGIAAHLPGVILRT
jgi:hypothetical protein